MKRTAAAWIMVVLLCAVAAPVLAQATAGGANSSPESMAPLVFVVPLAIFWGLYMLMIPVFILLGLASWVLTGLAIYDCVLRDFDERSTQALWCVLLFLTRWIGVLIYYFAVYRPDRPPRTGRGVRS